MKLLQSLLIFVAALLASTSAFARAGNPCAVHVDAERIASVNLQEGGRQASPSRFELDSMIRRLISTLSRHGYKVVEDKAQASLEATFETQCRYMVNSFFGFTCTDARASVELRSTKTGKIHAYDSGEYVANFAGPNVLSLALEDALDKMKDCK